MLCGLGAVMQVSGFDGLAFDPFSLQQDGLATPEVDVGRSEVGEVNILNAAYSIRLPIGTRSLIYVGEVTDSATFCKAADKVAAAFDQSVSSPYLRSCRWALSPTRCTRKRRSY